MLKASKRSILALAISLAVVGQSQAVETTVAGGLFHNVFVNSYGDVFATGNNRFGQVGAVAAVTPIYSSTGAFVMNRDMKYDVPIHVGLVNVRSVAAAGHRSAALKKDGTVYFWGLVSNLKQGTPSDALATTVPQAVNLTGVIDIALSGTKLLLLKESAPGSGVGTVYEWSFDPNVAPTAVPGLPVNEITSIAAGTRWDFKIYPARSTTLENLDHYRALGADGTVYVWGVNDHGQLGVGDYQDRPTPVSLAIKAKTINVGPASGFVVADSGDVYQSGWFTYEAGLQGRASLTLVDGVFGVDHVSAMSSGAYAILADGGIFAWGWHNYIGAGGYLRSDAATFVPELQGVRQIGTGHETFTAELGDGFNTIGGNGNGQLGDGSFIEKHSFPNGSIIDQTTISQADGLLAAGDLSWVDPDILQLRICLETAVDPASCDLPVADQGAQVNALEEQMSNLQATNNQLLAEIESLKAQLMVNSICTTDKKHHANNGIGNGDQDAPGRSGPMNAAENISELKLRKVRGR